MTKRDQLKEYREFLLSLSEEENAKRDLYLKQLATGEIAGPATGFYSIDKPFLSNYDDEAILNLMPNETLYDYIFNRNKDRMDLTAYYYFDKKGSFSKLERKVDICCKSFLESGIKKGDIVSICMPNTPEALIAILALNKIGAVASMINAKSSAEEIKNAVNECDSTILITIDKCYDGIQTLKDSTSLKYIVNVHPNDSMKFLLKTAYKIKYKKELSHTKNDGVSIEWKDFFLKGYKSTKTIDKAEFEMDKTAVIMRSGGTSGVTKGVELTNYNIVSMIEQFALGINNFAPGEKMLAVMPVFHGFGLVSSIMLPLAQGVGVILIPDPKKVDLIGVINKYEPEHILGVPTLFNAIKMKVLKIIEESKDKIQDFGKVLKLNKGINFVSGGDADGVEKERLLNEFFNACGYDSTLEKGYGLTECVAGVTFAAFDYNELGSCGIPMIKTNLKIIDQATGDELEEGEIGEICVMSPSVMKGYYNRPDSTSKAIPDGWLHTGDLGYIKNNMLYFTQRKGDMIISSGYNVYPTKVEESILLHPAIDKCMVIGKKDEYRGEVPKAFVIMKNGYELTPEIISEIKKICSGKMEKHAIPVEFEARTNFPETKLGKPSRALLKLEEDIKNQSNNAIDKESLTDTDNKNRGR